MREMFSERLNGWHVTVHRFGDTAPVVTAARYVPAEALEQVVMADATPAKVRAWAAGLGVLSMERAA